MCRYRDEFEMVKIVNLSKTETQNIKELYGLWTFTDACLDAHILIIVSEII